MDGRPETELWKAIEKLSAQSSKNYGTDLDSGHQNREKWAKKAEFILSCIGLAVGMSNVWRFPYLAYKNGGGAFLVAYAILLVIVGKPIFFMELAIGQFAGVCPVMVWKCFPLAKGVGIAMVVMSTLTAIYYNVIMMYSLYYAAQSLRSQLPWKECSEWWGADETCYSSYGSHQTGCEDMTKEHNDDYRNMSLALSVGTNAIHNLTSWDSTHHFQTICNATRQPASEQFWERYVLQLTDGIENLGSLKWDLTFSLLATWLIVACGLIKGIRSTGKVVYVTATFPYVVLLCLVVYGCTLDGAVDGLKYFFIPKWESLLEIQVWRAAGEQMVFTLSLGFGCLIMYSSYNDFNNNIGSDAVYISILDFLTSIVAGVVIFSVLGNMSYDMGVEIANVAKGGQGLSFVTYPEALARLPLSQLWSFLFFIMLFSLAIDSQFSFLETFFTVIFDRYPNLRKRKMFVTFGCCIMFFVAGLPCVTQGGQYVFNLMDVYAGGYACLFLVTAEVTVIMWGYGANRFADDIEFMLSYRPGVYWLICWKYVSPIVLLFVLIYGMSVHEPIQYAGTPYPSWAEALGWMLTMASLIQIPLWAIIEFFSLRKKGRSILKPHPDWGPADPEIRLRYLIRMHNQQKKTEELATGVVNIAMNPVVDDFR